MTSVNAILWEREMRQDEPPPDPEHDLSRAAIRYAESLAVFGKAFDSRVSIRRFDELKRAAIAYANAQEDEE